MTGPLLVTAWLSSPLAGDAPHLDALLEWSLAPFEAGFRAKQDRGDPHERVDRARPCPPQAAIRIPLMRKEIDGWNIPRCSSPILAKATSDNHDHIGKRIGVEHAGLLREDERKIITMTNAWTKSYRLPLRIRSIACVRWFALGNRQNVRKALKDVPAIGKKVADGYGRVTRWTVEDIERDMAFVVDGVLMRPMPLAFIRDGLRGYVRTFGACVSPYWHPERYTEIVVPC